MSAAAAGLTLSPLSAFSSESKVTARHTESSEFFLPPGLVYFNTATLGPCRRETIDETIKAWQDLETFPVKYYGRWGAEPLINKTRTIGAKFLNCDVDELAITTSTTDGMNAIAQGLRLKQGNRILTTDQEHHGGGLCWQYFAKYYGAIVDTVKILEDDITDESILDKISRAITSSTTVISVSHILSSTGRRLPIAKISALARSKNILCVVDGAQAVGAIKVDLKELECNAYATSGHKWLMGPKGTGLLFVAKEIQDVIRPMQFEESYKTFNESNGVANLPGILGLAKAIEYLESIQMAKVEESNLALRNKLHTKLSNISGLIVAGPASGLMASPLLAIHLPEKIESSDFVRMLFEKHKLSIRATHRQWFNGIRFSCHIFNDEAEVDFAVKTIRTEMS